MAASAGPLAGRGVLVTRPAERAASLCALIEKHGGRALAFPVIRIAPPRDRAALRSALERLGEAHLVIFVSVHALHGVLEALGGRPLRIPPGVRVAAVGPKTAARCARADVRVDFAPRRRINSEGLLEELSGFDVAGRDVFIFRGQSGREVLRDGLQSRGARVRYVESYRRALADPPVAPLLARWGNHEIHGVVVGSGAVVDALLRLIGPRGRTLLEATPIFTYSRRVADYCREIGLGGEIRVAGKPTDESVVEAIVEWAAA